MYTHLHIEWILILLLEEAHLYEFRKNFSCLSVSCQEILSTQCKDFITLTEKQDNLLRNEVNHISCYSLCWSLFFIITGICSIMGKQSHCISYHTNIIQAALNPEEIPCTCRLLRRCSGDRLIYWISMQSTLYDIGWQQSEISQLVEKNKRTQVLMGCARSKRTGFAPSVYQMQPSPHISTLLPWLIQALTNTANWEVLPPECMRSISGRKTTGQLLTWEKDGGQNMEMGRR